MVALAWRDCSQALIRTAVISNAAHLIGIPFGNLDVTRKCLPRPGAEQPRLLAIHLRNGSSRLNRRRAALSATDDKQSFSALALNGIDQAIELVIRGDVGRHVDGFDAVAGGKLLGQPRKAFAPTSCERNVGSSQRESVRTFDPETR